MAYRRTNRVQKESGRAEARPPPAPFPKISAIEDVVTDRRHALHAPARRNIARVEKERVARDRGLQPLIDDPGNGHGGLPLAIAVDDARQAVPVNERELPALEQHPAIGCREAA